MFVLLLISKVYIKLSENKLLIYLWYLNLKYILKGLEVIKKFNNNNNDDSD